MWKRRHAYLISFVVAGIAILPWGLLQPRLLEDARNFVFDSFQRLAPRIYDRDTPVRVVGVDEESLAALGQWPWPRTRLVELVTRLRDLGAAAIAFDFIFAEPDRSSFENVLQSIPDGRPRDELIRNLAHVETNDQSFARAIGAAPVVLGVTLTSSEGAQPPQKAGFVMAGDDAKPFLTRFFGVVAPIPLVAEAAKGLGATNWIPDHDQIVRRVPLLCIASTYIAPSLALEALRIAQGETTFILRSSNASGQTAFGRQTGVNAVKVGAFEIATGAAAEVRPRYAGMNPARDISAVKVLRSRVDRAEIEGRVIFVGALAAGLGDVRATPLEASVPGVEIHAQILESIASGSLLFRPDWAPGLEFVVAFVSFVSIMTLLFMTPQLFSIFVGVIGVAALFCGSFYLFDREGLLLDPAYPSATIVVGYLVGALTLWRLEQNAKQHVQRVFGKFVAPAVVDRLMKNPERLVLGGEMRELTVLFSDLRGFSALSEGMSARELTQFMNDYLTPMTDAILECDGTIDKYMGDAILAFWNAPLDVPEHPRRAVMAALRMRSSLDEFNRARAADARKAERPHQEVRMGLGLDLGACSVGNMGSIRRFDYSIVGDIVNIASRLDGACKMFNTDIIASGAVRDAAPEFAWLELGEVIVLGRSTPTSIATLIGDADYGRGAEFMEWRQAHEAMLLHYAGMRFDQAAKIASDLAKTAPSKMRALYIGMEARFSALGEARSPGPWSPIWVLGQK
jgi:adenylate cyclase